MIVWADTETTGLDPEHGNLLEVALVVTDDDLEEVAARSVVVQPIAPLGLDSWREHLDPFILDMHSKSGLLDEIFAGAGLLRHEAAGDLIGWALSRSAGFDLKKTPLAGSTVSFDRAWLKKHMPALESLFSHRSIDASSITELAARWAPAIYDNRPKADPEKIAHRALPDVRESISILRYYHSRGFVGGCL